MGEPPIAFRNGRAMGVEIVMCVQCFFPQSVARSYEERYREVSEELKALNGVKQKLSSLEEEIQSLLKANKV